MRDKRIRSRKRPCRAAIVLLMTSSSLVAARAMGAVANWLNPVDGNWTDPTKWSTNPIYPRNNPPSSYQANISAGGSPYTLTLDAGSAPGGLIQIDSILLDSPNVTVVATSGTTSAAVGGLTINAGKFRLNGGGLKNFVISGADNSFQPSLGTLDHVTINGNVMGDDGFPTYQTPLIILNGLTLNAASFSSRPFLQYQYNQALSGTGSISTMANTFWAVLYGKLTIAPGISIHGAGTIEYSSTDAVILNQGTIRAETGVGSFIQRTRQSRRSGRYE